jgi:hypothetical protein
VGDIIEFAKHLIGEAHARSLCLSAFGSLAIRMQSEGCPDLRVDANRQYKDIDLVSLSPNQEPLHCWLGSLGWERLEDVFLGTDGRRAVYKSDGQPFAIEIFFDELSFCHRIDLIGRINNERTLPLGDLLLTKLQRVDPRAKDLEDIAALLACKSSEFSLPNAAATKRIAEVLSSDWGFSHTSVMNLARVNELAPQSAFASILSQAGALRSAVTARSLIATINRSPKSVIWQLRSFVGERYRWYHSVEPLADVF